MQEKSKGTERNVMNKKNTVKMEHLKHRKCTEKVSHKYTLQFTGNTA